MMAVYSTRPRLCVNSPVPMVRVGASVRVGEPNDASMAAAVFEGIGVLVAVGAGVGYLVAGGTGAVVGGVGVAAAIFLYAKAR